MAKWTTTQTLLRIYLIFSCASSPAARATVVIPNPSLGLLARDAGACPSSFARCGDPKLPSNFCCPASSACISLDDSSSAICCPNGSDCSVIRPIACNLQLQNATADPGATVKTIRLDDTLPTCGSACCPFGYRCQSDGNCALDDAASSTVTSSMSLSSTLTWTSSTSATDSPIKASATTTSDAPPPSSFATSLAGFNTGAATLAPNCPSFPTKALAAGFFPGVACGAMAALLVMVCWKRRRKSHHPSTSSKGPHLRKRSSDRTLIDISGPIPSEENSFRTEFLRHSSGNRDPERTKSMLHRTGTRVKSFFGSTPKPTNRTRYGGGNSPPPPPPPPLPVTPPQQVYPRRQPSTEFIKVYSPAGGLVESDRLRPAPLAQAQARPNTTFTEMMVNVGFQNERGSPYFRIMDTPDLRDRGARDNRF
ncbi:hypothetical protein VTN02DRAFT_5289 [Thermoascus thermophilus]